MAYRELSADPKAESDFDRFLTDLYDELTQRSRDPNDVVRDVLSQIYFGNTATPISEQSPPAARAVLQSFDPRNVTTEPEYYSDVNLELYLERKPYIWLWQMFDRSPLGQNAILGHRFRRMLAPFIFKRVGKNFKCWHFVEWSFGYNLSFGDNVVIHRHVLLDDRGQIDVGNDVSISDYVNIYSHGHDIDDIEKVYTRATRIGDGARLTYHATVLAGVEVGNYAMIGSGAIVTKDVEPYHVALGIPARSVRVKTPAKPSTTAPGD